MSIKALQVQLEQVERATAAHRLYDPSATPNPYSGVSVRQGHTHNSMEGHPLLASPRQASPIPHSKSLSALRFGSSDGRSSGTRRHLPALRVGTAAPGDPTQHREVQSACSAALKQVERAAATQLQQTLDRMLGMCPESWEAQLRVYESVLNECVQQVKVHCTERGLVLEQLRDFFVHAANSFLALCKRKKLDVPPYYKSSLRAKKQIEELRAEISVLQTKLKRAQSGHSAANVAPAGNSFEASSPREPEPSHDGFVGFTDKILAAILSRLDSLVQSQLRLVLDAAVSRLAADARCDWLRGAMMELSDDEVSLLLALQLKSRGAADLLASASRQLSSAQLAALFLAFLPQLDVAQRIECFNATLKTMDVAQVLQVAETLLRVSPDGAEVLSRLFNDISDRQRRRHMDALAAGLEDDEWDYLLRRRAELVGTSTRKAPPNESST